MSKRNVLSILPVLGIALSCSIAYADTTTPSDDNSLKITIPKFQSGFEFNMAAIALQPTASNLDYAIIAVPFPLPSPSWQQQEISPTYSAAFALGARYIASGGKDADLVWTHLNTSSSSTATADGTDHMIGPSYEIGPDAGDNRTADGKVQFNYDTINLEMGHFVDVGNSFEMRFFTGISTGFLREDVDANFAGTYTPPAPVNKRLGASAGPFTCDSTYSSSYTGVGPRLGMQAGYKMGSFSFTAEGAASALIGVSHDTTDFASTSPVLTEDHRSVNYQSIADDNTTQIVPGFDSQLGLNYTHAFHNNSLIMTISGGFQTAIYIDAINQYMPASLVTDSKISQGTIAVATMSHTQSNYGVHGPFAKLALQF
jgi:hypothetical protein